MFPLVAIVAMDAAVWLLIWRRARPKPSPVHDTAWQIDRNLAVIEANIGAIAVNVALYAIVTLGRLVR